MSPEEDRRTTKGTMTRSRTLDLYKDHEERLRKHEEDVEKTAAEEQKHLEEEKQAFQSECSKTNFHYHEDKRHNPVRHAEELYLDYKHRQELYLDLLKVKEEEETHMPHLDERSRRLVEKMKARGKSGSRHRGASAPGTRSPSSGGSNMSLQAERRKILKSKEAPIKPQIDGRMEVEAGIVMYHVPVQWGLAKVPCKKSFADFEALDAGLRARIDADGLSVMDEVFMPRAVSSEDANMVNLQAYIDELVEKVDQPTLRTFFLGKDYAGTSSPTATGKGSTGRAPDFHRLFELHADSGHRARRLEEAKLKQEEDEQRKIVEDALEIPRSARTRYTKAKYNDEVSKPKAPPEIEMRGTDNERECTFKPCLRPNSAQPRYMQVHNSPASPSSGCASSGVACANEAGYHAPSTVSNATGDTKSSQGSSSPMASSVDYAVATMLSTLNIRCGQAFSPSSDSYSRNAKLLAEPLKAISDLLRQALAICEKSPGYTALCQREPLRRMQGQLVPESTIVKRCQEPDAICQREDNLSALMDTASQAQTMLQSIVTPGNVHWEPGVMQPKPIGMPLACFAVAPSPPSRISAKVRAAALHGPSEGEGCSRHLLDLARLTLVYPTCELLEQGINEILRNHGDRVVKMTNFFRTPNRLGARFVEMLFTVRVPKDMAKTDAFVDEVNQRGRVTFDRRRWEMQLVIPLAKVFSKQNSTEERTKQDKRKEKITLTLPALANPGAVRAALHDVAEVILFFQATTTLVIFSRDLLQQNVDNRRASLDKQRGAQLEEQHRAKAELLKKVLETSGVPRRLLKVDVRGSDNERIGFFMDPPKEDIGSLERAASRKDADYLLHICELRLEVIEFYNMHAQARPHWLAFEDRLRAVYKPVAHNVGTDMFPTNLDALLSVALATLASPQESLTLRKFRRSLAKRFGSTVSAWRHWTSQRFLNFDSFRDVIGRSSFPTDRDHLIELWMELIPGCGAEHFSLFDLDPEATALMVDFRGRLLRHFGEDDHGKFRVNTTKMCEMLLGSQGGSPPTLMGNSTVRKQLPGTASLKHFMGGGQLAERLVQYLDLAAGTPSQVTSRDIEWLMRLQTCVDCDDVLLVGVEEQNTCSFQDFLWWAYQEPTASRPSRAAAIDDCPFDLDGLDDATGGRFYSEFLAGDSSDMSSAGPAMFSARSSTIDGAMFSARSSTLTGSPRGNIGLVTNESLARPKGTGSSAKHVKDPVAPRPQASAWFGRSPVRTGAPGANGRFKARGPAGGFTAAFVAGEFRPEGSSAELLIGAVKVSSNKFRCVASSWCGRRCVFTFAADQDVWIEQPADAAWNHQHDPSNEEIVWERILEADPSKGNTS